MYQPLKVLSFAVATLLFSLSSPRSLIAITPKAVASDSQTQTTQESIKTIEFSKATLAIARERGDRDTELKILIALGDAYNSIGEYEQAVESANASLALAQELQNSQAKAVAFVTLASAYQSLASTPSDYQKALKAARASLTTAWTIKDHESEAKALAILGSVYNSLNQNQNALVFAELGVKVGQENNMLSATASSLLTLASVHLKEGQYPQVIEPTEQGRDYLQKLQQREAESAALVMQSLAYLGQGNSRQSKEIAERGLAISREVKRPLIEALALIVLSLNYRDSGEFQKALDSINQSRVIAQEQKNPDLEALILEVRGEIYRSSKQNEQAIASFQESLSIKESYSTKAAIARVYQESNLLGTAISYYKQAINQNEEQVPRKIPGLPIWLQDSFPQAVQNIMGLSAAEIYRSSTNLLLSGGRSSEAQQVLELLKEQELREYTDTEYADKTTASTSRKQASLALSSSEEQIVKKYGSLITFGKQLDECQQTRCPELEQLSQERASLTQQYYQNLGNLETEIRNNRASDEAFVDPNNLAIKAQEIVESQPGTLIIYPLVMEGKIWILWASKGGILKSLEVENVSQIQLEETVLKFRKLLQNRLSNIEEVKATGKQLYDWLIKPLEPELKANNIHNLVFSLDRSTRYIPMSALFDGEKYLVENYTVSTVLSANLTDTRSSFQEDNKDTGRQSASQAPVSKSSQYPSILALGLSDAVAGFKPLPNVPAELDAIVQKDSGEAQGVYPGQEFLNGSFDFFALRDHLSGHQFLHIATHSKFVPGPAKQSFLLLGTGQKLAIPEIETWLNLRDVDLVVLSACETALGGPGLNGREIAGVGYYFLKGGAKTVMASLWNVDDQSTRLLMEQFYKNLAQGTPQSPVTKAEALRQAQLVLLSGKDTATSRPLPNALRSLEQQGDSLPPVPKKTSFRHPYYWAPFILMGSGL